MTYYPPSPCTLHLSLESRIRRHFYPTYTIDLLSSGLINRQPVCLCSSFAKTTCLPDHGKYLIKFNCERILNFDDKSTLIMIFFWKNINQSITANCEGHFPKRKGIPPWNKLESESEKALRFDDFLGRHRSFRSHFRSIFLSAKPKIFSLIREEENRGKIFCCFLFYFLLFFQRFSKIFQKSNYFKS